MAQGNWVGAPADVNWCEPDFEWTPWVAEPLNTLSSLPMVVLGLFGVWWAWRSAVAQERRFSVSFLGLALVGAGSAAFHGTLLRWAQALDELPMIWLGLVGVWTVWHRTAPREHGHHLSALAVVFSVLFSVAYLRSPTFFSLFITTYALSVAAMVVAAARATYFQPAPDVLKRAFTMPALSYLGALSLCWVPEHVLLPCDHPLQALPLHALWHLGAGFGTYMWTVWTIVDRRQAEGTAVEMDLLPAPVVRLP